MLITVKTTSGTNFAINPSDISTVRDDGNDVRVTFTNGSNLDVGMRFDDFMKLIKKHNNVNSYDKMTDAVCEKLEDMTTVITAGLARIGG